MENLLNDQIMVVEDSLNAFQQYWDTSFNESEEIVLDDSETKHSLNSQNTDTEMRVD